RSATEPTGDAAPLSWPPPLKTLGPDTWRTTWRSGAPADVVSAGSKSWFAVSSYAISAAPLASTAMDMKSPRLRSAGCTAVQFRPWRQTGFTWTGCGVTTETANCGFDDAAFRVCANDTDQGPLLLASGAGLVVL